MPDVPRRISSKDFEIVAKFEAVRKQYPIWLDHNWVQDPGWWIRGEPQGTYINGVVCVLDFDYRVGYLLQVCDQDKRSGDTVTAYLGIVYWPAPDSAYGAKKHEWFRSGETAPFFSPLGWEREWEAIAWFTDFVKDTLQQVEGI